MPGRARHRTMPAGVPNQWCGARHRFQRNVFPPRSFTERIHRWASQGPAGGQYYLTCYASWPGWKPVAAARSGARGLSAIRTYHARVREPAAENT